VRHPDLYAGLPAELRQLLYLTEEIIPAPEGADFGMSRGMLRTLGLIARKDSAGLRARMLRPLLASWLRMGRAGRRRISTGTLPTGRPPGLLVSAVACHPRTGPPVPVSGGRSLRRARLCLAESGP
jgi:hypothetical protein